MGNEISLEMIVVAVLAFAAFIYWKNRQRDDEGRIPDLAVTANKVEEVLENFKAKYPSSDKKINEADIQRQLLEFFEEEFHHVQSQKPIGGIYAKQIDYDIGRERVGVEIKMAKSVYRKAEFDRLGSQVKGYAESYPDDNLLLLIFCSDDEHRKRIKKTAIEEALEEYPVRVRFPKISA